MYRIKKKTQDKALNEDFLVEVKPLEPWPDPPPKKRLYPESASAQKSKGKFLDEDFLVKVKPLEPWPNPPIKKLPSQQPDSKPTVNPAPAGKGSKTPAKKD